MYTKKVIDALRKCNGISEYLILIQQDGLDKRGDIGQSSVRSLCESIDFAEARILTESKHLGCNENTRRALASGFLHSDYVIHMEDDVMMAPDALRYFEWARQFGSDASLFIASAWCHPKGWKPSLRKPKPSNVDDLVGSDPWLWIWGFSTWRDRWEQMESEWTKCTNDQHTSWDCHLNDNVKGIRQSLVPYTSRSINIGEKGGTHRGSFMLEYWAGSPGFKTSGTYKRV